MEVTSPVRAEMIDIVYRERSQSGVSGAASRGARPRRARGAAPRRVGGEGTSRHRSCRTAPHVAPPRPGGRPLDDAGWTTHDRPPKRSRSMDKYRM